MVKYHPDARFLTDYSAGSLPVAQALCVATHLHYCKTCRARIRELTELGALLFQQQSPIPAPTDRFDSLLHRIESLPATPAPDTDPAPAPAASALPRPLHKLTKGNLESLSWRRIGKSFRYSKLKTGDQGRETALLHIKAGGNVPHHRHVGDEITVVIRGSFSDQDDKYGIGDFIVRTSGEQHKPVASQDDDCLCLSALDHPIVLSNPIYRLLSRLL
jgi:putative transcriptional regulator